MSTRKLLLTIVIVSCLILVTGCSGFAGQTLPRNTAGEAPTRTPTAVSTSLPVTAAATATPSAGRTSPPTQNVISILVTQAHLQVTPIPRMTQPPLPTAAATSIVPPDIARLLTPTATHNPAPASVIFSEPIQIANAVSAADCKIRKGGDCTPVMAAGQTLFFTWTFGVQGERSFQWGQAAIVVTRDGETIQWTQAGNGLVRPPNPDTNESWTLNVGQSAEFAGGLENAQPGYYTARLMMCLLSMSECNEGKDWQPVGGESINFLITP
jgi:hypothetical protein